ncbi:hypothetical protein AAF712_014646 [Marasmius tenuissimus]|uniref:Ricin B lectin domain-containing protein n=1 Tax=Marasmius tenuissimus TaxID=585030 RepID=A0ABR2ZBK6_9AGAR
MATATQAQNSGGSLLLAQGIRPHISSVCLTAVSNNDGAKVSLGYCVDASPELPNGNITWVMPDVGKTGQIKTFNGKCLDVPGGDASNGNSLQIWSCSEGNANQMWSHAGVIEGQWVLSWAGKNKCVDVRNGNYDVMNNVSRGTLARFCDYCAAADRFSS